MVPRIFPLIAILSLTLSSAATALSVQEKPSSAAPSRGDAPPLVIGTPMGREMNGGETHTYRITMTSGQYLRVVVDQQGIDVSVSLIDPKGQKVLEVDSPNGNKGPEPVSAIAEASGEHLIEVRSANKAAKAGRYEIKLEALRVPTDLDRDRVAAESKFREARKLSQQQPATSRRQAIEKYEEALPVFRALGDRAMEAFTFNMAGLLYHSFGELQKAMDYYSRALPISRAIGDTIREAHMLNNIGAVHDALGNPQEALEHYKQALSFWQNLDLKDQQGNTLNNIGLVYFNLGELQKALEYYLQALPLRRAGSNRRLEADTLDNLGHLCIVLGEQQRALENLQQALKLRQAAKDLRGEANTLQKIGFAYASSGDVAGAQQFHNQALPLWRAAADRQGESLSLRDIGVALSAAGSYDKALEYLQQALQLQQAIQAQREQAITLSSIGDVYTLSAQPQKALEHYTQSLTLFRAVDDKRGQATALQGLARAERDRSDLATARQYIEEAITKIEAVRGQVDIQLRASYLGVKHDAYQFYIDLLMRMHRANPSARYDASALQVSERAHARSLLESLSEGRLNIRQGVDAALLERERALAQQINAKAERLIQARAQNAKERVAALNKELSELEDQYRQAQTAIRKVSPGYAALTQPEPLGLKEIQAQLLDKDSLLLEYSLGEERSYLWAVTADSITSYELPKRELIQQAATRVTDLLTARGTLRRSETPAQRSARIAEADAQLPEAARRLSEMVLLPAAAQLANRRLLIVLDGALQYVPFAMLPVAAGKGETVPLIVQNELVILPSASTLGVMRKELAGRQPGPKMLAVFADPVFADDDERGKVSAVRLGKSQAGKSATPAGAAEIAALGRGIAHDEGKASNVISGKLSIPRLPFTRQEAERILAVAPGTTNLKALDFKANRAAAISGELGQYRYLHFATHGLLDTERPGLSALVLSLVDEKGNAQDGFLRAHEIYNLKLPAELVVLSACQTGLGKEIKGEGLVGLTRGFMYAGAARVVVSLWNVNDKATADLMAKFYQKMLKTGERPAAALRAAQVEMWRQKQWQAPYYWAAFVMQGEWK